MSSMFSGFRIVHRVLLLAFVAFAGTGAVTAILVTRSQVEATYRIRMDHVTQQEALVVAMMGRLHEAQSHEKDFLLDRNMDAATAFGEKTVAVRTALEDLLATAAPRPQAGLEALGDLLTAYENAFAELVARNRDLGLNETDGFEGAMRSAVHSIEEVIGKIEDKGVMAGMLTLRRHEKDFILRRDARYIGSFDTALEEFTALVRAAFRPGAQRQKILDARDIYTSAFRMYADASLEEVKARKAVLDAYEAMLPQGRAVIGMYSDEKNAAIADIGELAQRSAWFVIAAMSLTILLVLVCVWLVGRSITRPVTAITAAMRDIARGNTGIQVPGLARRDEFGAMASALEIFRQSVISTGILEKQAADARARAESERQDLHDEAQARARENLREATAGLAAALERLATGDLSFRLQQPFASDFETLRHDLNSTINQLDHVMGEIVTSGTMIGSSSGDIGRSTGELARRTERQAVSVSETADSLVRIAGNISDFAGHVEEARKVAAVASDDAIRSGSLVSGVISAMERIEQSATKIAGIVTMIDEIAFQTNLLALNAGVEAARAGEAGRGFAVVAHEVRELSRRSSAAAGEIRELIGNSSHEVAEGVRFVHDTGAALAGISESVTAISDRMQMISSTVREQSGRLDEISSVVSNIDQMTRENSAMVQENSTATAVLVAEAARLETLVGVFRLGAGDEAAVKRDEAA